MLNRLQRLIQQQPVLLQCQKQYQRQLMRLLFHRLPVNRH
jgi:hypothetical protein